MVSGKGSISEKVEIVIQVSDIPHVKVQILSFNIILISSPWRVPRPSYPFRVTFGRSGKRSFTVKAKRDNLCSLCSAPESTGSKLLCDPYLISVGVQRLSYPFRG